MAHFLEKHKRFSERVWCDMMEIVSCFNLLEGGGRMIWESRKSTDDDQVFETINATNEPIAIVLFGVESELKQIVRIMCWRKIQGLFDGSSREKLMNLERAYRAYRAGKKVIVVMPEEVSAWEYYRIDVVKALYRLGFEKVIGIFAKKTLVVKPPRCNEPRAIEMNNLIRALEMKPPEAREFDQLIIVEDIW